eukprot:3352994-Lingulodinium_polyedra.AAC.1
MHTERPRKRVSAQDSDRRPRKRVCSVFCCPVHPKVRCAPDSDLNRSGRSSDDRASVVNESWGPKTPKSVFYIDP